MYQKWLQAFHAVARLGSFTAAAGDLGVGQPTISTHVKSLEQHFRVELFYRRGRLVQLTPIGRRLLTITHGLYGHEDEAIALLRSAQGLAVGTLTLGAIRPSDVMEILAGFHAGHPDVRLSVNLGSTPAILERLARFECDIGIVGHAPQDARFHSQFYDRHRILVVVSTGHRFARRRTLRIRDLAGESLILRAEGSTTRASFDAALARAGVEVRPVMETDSREAVLRAVAHGIGIGVISEAELTPVAGIHALNVADTAMFTYAYVVCLVERRKRPLLSAFLELAASKAHIRKPVRGRAAP